MKTEKKLRLNLASHPQKNKRFFHFLLFAAGFFVLLIAVIGGSLYFRYGNKVNNIQAEINTTDQMIKNSQRNETRFSSQSTDATKIYSKRIEMINSLIYKKSFSWINLLTALERGLPKSSYIISLAPTLKSDFLMEVKFKVITSNLKDLLKLYTKLQALKFQDIRFLSEGRSETGQMVTEISFIYERTI